MAQVYCVFLDPELNTVKQRLVSMHQISGTNSLKTAALLRLRTFLFVLILYCTVTFILEFYSVLAVFISFSRVFE